MIKILQIGEGNFLRAFAEHYIQCALEAGISDGRAAICQPRSNTSVINALKKQNGKYNILIKGRLGGELVNKVKPIDCIEECIDTLGEYDRLKKLFKSRELELVISNTTEAGICFDEKDKIKDSPSISFPAKVTALLYERFKAGKEGLVFLPVELIESNGDALKSCILKYAELWSLESEFIDYINLECHFCNTLVDRIVTGKTEYKDDNCAVACEPYSSWLIEADDYAKSKIPFTRLDMGAKFVDSISPYRERKVKILNGAHTMSVLAAYNAGHTIVRDMVNDRLFGAYIKKGLNEEILKTIDLPENELKEFANGVIERFGNPFIDHRLLDISLNSVSKFKTRCLCSYLDYYNKFKKAPDVLSFSLAALISFYENPNEKAYTVNDIDSVLSFFGEAHGDLVYEVMKNSDFWDLDLTEIDGAYDKVKLHFDEIKKHGVKAAMEKLING